jgi:hypothetical protein
MVPLAAVEALAGQVVPSIALIGSGEPTPRMGPGAGSWIMRTRSAASGPVLTVR